MSSKRDDGLSIAVWENSPWRSFIRFRDNLDAADNAGHSSGRVVLAQLIREDVAQPPPDPEDVREIFGRALDVARSRKSFASAASLTQSRNGFSRSEARLMAEDHQKWGHRSPAGCRVKGKRGESRSGSVDGSSSDGVRETGDEGQAFTAQSHGELPDNTCASVVVSGPTAGTGRAGNPQSPLPRHGGAGGLHDGGDAPGPLGSQEALVSVPPRAPNQLTMAGLSDAPVQLGNLTRSPQGMTSRCPSPVGDATSAGSPGPGRGAARGRAKRPYASNAAGAVSGAKPVHTQPGHMPMRRSNEILTTHTPLSPGSTPPSRRSNSFDGGRGEEAGPPHHGRVPPATAPGGGTDPFQRDLMQRRVTNNSRRGELLSEERGKASGHGSDNHCLPTSYSGLFPDPNMLRSGPGPGPRTRASRAEQQLPRSTTLFSPLPLPVPDTRASRHSLKSSGDGAHLPPAGRSRALHGSTGDGKGLMGRLKGLFAQ